MKEKATCPVQEQYDFRSYHMDLRGLELPPVRGVNEKRIGKICRTVRGLMFAMIEKAKSGHPGGSSSKVEQLVTLLCSGELGFDPYDPKDTGRDRIVWSAGHCSPLLHSLNALISEFGVSEKLQKFYVTPRELMKFRTTGGPSGHVESHYALADASTGASGHGLSAGLGFALLHRSCGLPMKTFVIMGDAETEEGMTFEARNIAANVGTSNLVVLLDHNGFGIDGPITEVMSTACVDQWRMMGWNVIEVDGHDIRQLAHAYKLANENDSKPTVIISHTVKGKFYGKLENTCTSHGSPLGTPEYIEAMKALDYSVLADGYHDIEEVLGSFGKMDRKYFGARLRVAAKKIIPKDKLMEMMVAKLDGRNIFDYIDVPQPETLPPELVFKGGAAVPTRKATEACFDWEMKHNAFFYVTTGDLSGSILTGKAEKVYGIMSRDNPLGRGIRSGIAEQNMSMMMTTMASDTLPGGYKPMTVFGSYGVFTSMMANPVRMALINNAMNPDAKAFFIMLAAHDGPETGEDGPTHHGLFWMSLFTAYPGIKVYKPLDANEAVAMYFHARKCGEPVAFSVARPNTPVFTRGDGGDTIAPASAANDGAYVFRSYANNGKRKLPIAVAGGQTMANLLKVLPQIEERADVKIIAVTSPELFEEMRVNDPENACLVLSDKERATVVALHNGYPGFMDAFLLPGDHEQRNLGIATFQHSGRPEEVYAEAELDPAGIARKVLGLLE